MMDILFMRSIPGALKTLAMATGKIREATALRRKVKIEQSKKGDQLVHVIIAVPASKQNPRVAVLLQSEVDQLLNSQPLKDGFVHATAMEVTDRIRSAMGAA